MDRRLEGAFGAMLVALAASAFAAPAKAQKAEQCVADHTVGQDERKSGRLLSAREKFIRCSADACPALVRRECDKLLSEVDGAIPSIIVRARDETGNDTSEVEVIADGQSVATRLGTTPIRLDPGERSLEFRHSSGNSIEKKLVLTEGERNRVVEIEFAREKPAEQPEPAAVEPPKRASQGLPAAVYVLGGVSVVALGSFAYFGLEGRSKESDLDTCTPRCTDAEYDDMAKSYLIADISLAVAVLAGGAALWIGLGSRDGGDKAPAVGATALPGGGALRLRTHF